MTAPKNWIFLLLLASSVAQAVSPENLYQVDYQGFTLWLDCSEHGAVQFRYVIQADTGSAPRSDDFKLDPDVPPACQPTSANAFRTEAPAPRYDRGHLVPANHMDFAETAIEQTFYMTNILPQTATLNRGAWLASEEIVECYRDLDTLTVIGGALWGNDASNDYFLASHGIRTPDAYWKVIIRSNGKTIAWLMPNDTTATRKRLDRYLITPAKLQKAIGYTLPNIPRRQLRKKPLKSWKLPKPVIWADGGWIRWPVLSVIYSSSFLQLPAGAINPSKPRDGSA